MRQLFRELKRRNVYRVAATYAAVAFVTLQAARLIFPATTLEGLYDKLVVLAFVGFPIALVIAWAFELTPEGVRRTPAAEDPAAPEGATAGGTDGASSSEPTPPDGRRSRSRLALSALVGLGLVGAAAAGGWYLVGSGGDTEPAPRAGARSIAVLPFENMGGEESEQFTRGMHDGLLTRLFNASGLKVTSRTSVMPYRESGDAVPVIADSLGVEWVMEGGVQRMGERVQVNAQLIQAEADVHRWAKTYTRELDSESFFAIQDELTREIAATLETQLTSAEKERVARTPTRDLRAYQLYVQGRRELARRSQGDMTRAVRLFRRAIERDSSFAEAWSGLADAAGTEWWGFDRYDTLGVTPSAAAHRALELDPELPEAHASMGLVHYRARRGPEALRELERAVALRPSYAEAHNWLGLTLKVLGRPREALGHLELAGELDPRNLLARHSSTTHT